MNSYPTETTSQNNSLFQNTNLMEYSFGQFRSSVLILGPPSSFCPSSAQFLARQYEKLQNNTAEQLNMSVLSTLLFS